MTCQHDFQKTIVSGIRDWELAVPGEFSYKECSLCGLITLHPHPSLNDLVSYYPSDYPAFQIGNRSKGFIYNKLNQLKNWAFRKKVEKIKPLPGTKVLDIGCGSGEILARFGDWGAGELHGIDFSPVACEIATQKGVKTYCGTFLDLQFPASAFDIVIMHHYIEHTLNPEAELQRAFEILKPGGVVLLELPNFRSLDQKLFGRFWGGNHIPRHTFQFKDHVLESLLVKCGFNEVAVEHEINPAHFALSIQNIAQYLKNGSNVKPVLGGRCWYFSLLLILLVPVQIVSKLLRFSGMITVTARK